MLGRIALIVIGGAILVNCMQPTAYMPAVNTEPVNMPEDTMEVENMNDFTVKPVKEYAAYYRAPSGQVFGVLPDIRVAADMDPVMPIATVDGEDFEKIPGSFFIIDGVIYFEVSHYFGPIDPENPEDVGETVVKYCHQSGGVLAYLDEESFPVEPDLMRGTFDDGKASLAVGDYMGQPISVAVRVADQARFDAAMELWREPAKKPTLYQENFGMVDGMIRIVDGYMLHVVEGRGSARLPGLLYWPDGEGRMDHTGKDAGRFWMM